MYSVVSNGLITLTEPGDHGPLPPGPPEAGVTDLALGRVEVSRLARGVVLLDKTTDRPADTANFTTTTT